MRDFSKLRLKTIEFIGKKPPLPGYYFEDIGARDKCLSGHPDYEWYLNNFYDHYVSKVRDVFNWDAEEPDDWNFARYYGVVWDLEPETNEFGVILP